MDGILLVNKPAGMTSRDVVNKVCKILGTKKIGHTGTLDKEVEGVLVLCVNKATKLVQFLTAENKSYQAEVCIGVSTDTEDAHGKIVTTKAVTGVKKNDIEKVLASIVGPLIQTPPMFSAIKVNGKRLYEYAYEGIEVERPSREITIFDLVLTSDLRFWDDCLYFDIDCSVSKGTYIRTLSVEIGERLGYPAHMSYLLRNKQGAFKLEDCVTLEEIENGNYNLISIDECLLSMEHTSIDEETYNRVRNGSVLQKFCEFDKNIVLYYNNKAVAIYEHYNKDLNKIKPVRVL